MKKNLPRRRKNRRLDCLKSIIGHPAQAEDLTQEAFLQLYRALHAGQSIANVRAWVFRVAHNLAINQIKSQQFVEPIDDRAWEVLRQAMEDAGPNPEQRLLRQKKFDRLRAAIARLTLAAALRGRRVDAQGRRATTVAPGSLLVVSRLDGKARRGDRGNYRIR